MRACVKWRVALSALALLAAVYRTPTVAAEPSNSGEDAVVLLVAADHTVEKDIFDKVIVLVSSMAAAKAVSPPGDAACFTEKHLGPKENSGLVHVTTGNTKCDAVANPRRLQLIYDKDAALFTTERGEKFKLDDLEKDPTLRSRLEQLSNQVIAARKKKETKENAPKPSAGVVVPIWSVVVIGILVGVLLATTCIFFSKIRKARAKAAAVDDAKKSAKSDKTGDSASSKRASSVKKQKKGSSGSSVRSSKSSKGKKKSSKGKKKSSSKRESCRSSRSLSTRSCKNSSGPTSVKVVAVAPPAQQKKKLEHVPPMGATDEVATVMALRNSSLPERTLERRVERPMTEDEFILSMKQVIHFVIDFYRDPRQYPVATDIRPNAIFTKLPKNAPEDPESFANVWQTFKEVIMPGCVQWQHPQFHAFFPCGRSYPDILAETVISSLGTVGFTWSANPAITELDTAMVNWMGRALGIPEPFLFGGNDMGASEGGGWIADTASDAIFCAVMAARHTKVEQEINKLQIVEDKEINESTKHTSKKYEKRAEIISKLVAYGSYESHSSFEKACKMACVRCRPIKVFENDDWGMRREWVEKEMQKDKQRGLIPFYLHVALGTTSTATSDHLHELTPLKELYNVWVHIDAAYAGSAWVVPEYRNNKGIEHVDSININLHKFFLTSTSVTLFWTRRQKDYKECFRVDPAYLKKKTGANDLRDWGIQLSRRFKSLKVYMLLRMYGLNGMRAYVKRICDMTRYMEEFIVKIPNIRKFGKTNYGLFCVQYQEPGMTHEQVNAATNRLCEYINDSRKMVLTHSNVRGHDILRICVTLERSQKSDIEESVKIFTTLVDEFKKKMIEDVNFVKSFMSSISRENLLQDVDMGIVGSPNPTLSKTPTNVRSTISNESLVGPRTANSQLSALTSVTQASTMMTHRPIMAPFGQQPTALISSPSQPTNIEALKTEQLSAPLLQAPPPAAGAAAAANMMPPLPPAFDQDPSSRTGGSSSYNHPASAAPGAAQPPAAKPADQQPTFSAPEVTARSDTMTEKK